MTGPRLRTANVSTALALAMITTMSAAAGVQAGLDQVLARIDGKRVIELTRTLVHIPSDYSEGTLANHQEIARFLVGELKTLGMEVHVVEPTPGYPLVIGRLRGTGGGPVLGMMGHYNTVPVGDRARWTVDPFAAEMRDGRIYGRGAYDQKGGIAALLVATRAIIESRVALRRGSYARVHSRRGRSGSRAAAHRGREHARADQDRLVPRYRRWPRYHRGRRRSHLAGG